MKWCAYAAGLKPGSLRAKPKKDREMARKKKDKPWHLKVTWALSILMLLLVFGFFYQSFEEMLKIAPVQVAVERIMESE
jgi:hypothetical protein